MFAPFHGWNHCDTAASQFKFHCNKIQLNKDMIIDTPHLFPAAVDDLEGHSSHPPAHPTRKQGSCGRTGWNSRHLLLLPIWRWHLHGLQEIPWSQTSTTVSHQHQQQSNTRRAPWTHCLLHSNHVKHILSTKSLSFFLYLQNHQLSCSLHIQPSITSARGWDMLVSRLYRY